MPTNLPDPRKRKATESEQTFFYLMIAVSVVALLIASIVVSELTVWDDSAPRWALAQQGLKEETAMNGKRALIVLAVATAQGFLGAASALANDMDSGHGGEVGGSVVPCSLAGINPAHHPEIFGNPAVAASYGFVRAPDGIWHVQCPGAGVPAAAGNYASTTQKAPGHHRKTTFKPSGRAVKGE